MKFNSSKLLPIGFASLLTIGSANAALIASYIDGTVSNGANLAAPVAGITVSALTDEGIGGDSSITTLTSATRGTETLTTPAGPTAGSAVGSLWASATRVDLDDILDSTNDYYTFTVTAESGNLPSLATLRFDMVAANVNSNGPLISTYQLFVSADGGAFASVGASGTATASSDDLFPGDQLTSLSPVTSANIDLSGLSEANSYVFRIALADNSGAGDKYTWIQGMQLTAIPEPSFALLGGLGLLVLLRRRR